MADWTMVAVTVIILLFMAAVGYFVIQAQDRMKAAEEELVLCSDLLENCNEAYESWRAFGEQMANATPKEKCVINNKNEGNNVV